MRVVRTAGSAKPAPVDAAPAHRSPALATTTTSAANAADTANVAARNLANRYFGVLSTACRTDSPRGDHAFPKFSRTHTDRSGEDSTRTGIGPAPMRGSTATRG